MNTVDGYAMSSWERGYGDFVMQPDLSTLRPVPWQPGTVLVLADLRWEDGSAGRRLAAADPRAGRSPGWPTRGLAAFVGTELEFIVFRDTYEQAWTRGYRDLTPANQYNVDYSLLGTARVEPLLRRIRNEHGRRRACTSSRPRASATSASTRSPSATPRRCAPATTTSIYKNGAKEIAAQEGMALTFMAKSERSARATPATSTCRCRGADGAPVMAGDGRRAVRRSGEHFLAGQLAAHARADPVLRAEHQLLQALRRRARSPRPRSRWGRDNRTCALRLVGHGAVAAGGEPGARRRREPVPGGRRDDRGRAARHRATSCSSSRRSTGNAYDDPTPRACPTTLREALDLWREQRVRAP